MDSNNDEVSPEAKNSVEESLTMLDVLEQEQMLDEEYAAVLGGSDEKCCTYSNLLTRQALYSCLTCTPEVRESLEHAAGICLACSYRCHENHELIELYTKRRFRCDCPTTRNKGRCLLNSEFDKPQPPNEENQYNDNFKGIYCTCKRPYPDPERTAEEVMLQCAICEDWFHLQHLDVPPSAAKLVDICSEMICGACMERHSFLRDYTGHALKALDDADESQANITVSGDVSVCEDNDNKLRSDLDKSISEIMNMGENDGAVTNGENGTDKPPVEETATEEPPAKRTKEEENNESVEATKSEEINACKRPRGKTDYEKGATFWSADWRTLALCRCDECLTLYKSESVDFLLDPEDPSKAYEERGMKREATAPSTYEQGIRALASIGRVQQIDAITEYNRMKDKLKAFLQSFAATKKVVTEEDINRFFAEMRNEKNTNLGQPYFCR